jgi:hypothetical protein
MMTSAVTTLLHPLCQEVVAAGRPTAERSRAELKTLPHFGM